MDLASTPTKMGLPCLEDLIRQANADGREVLGVIDLLRLFDGLTDHVVDGAQADLMIVK